MDGSKQNNIVHKPKKKFLIVSIILIAIGIIGYLFLSHLLTYNKAMAYLEEKKFEQAIELFMELEDYQDSEEMLLESKYSYAIQKKNQDNFLTAISIFEEISPYKDSKTLSSEMKYLLAHQYMEKEDFRSAMNTYAEIKKYKDSEELLTEAKYNLAKEHLFMERYVEASNLFKQIKDYKDANILLQEAIYLEAKNKYTTGSFSEAKELFQSLKSFKDSNSYIEKIDILQKVQGTWENASGVRQVIFDVWKVYTVHFPNSYRTRVFEWDYEIEGNQLKILSDWGYSFSSSGTLIEKDSSSTEEYKKTSTSSFVPGEKPSPSIGMTEEEVRNSNWGPPMDINRTTTAYGVSEQWVYAGYKYIYLEDGIVTSIQE